MPPPSSPRDMCRPTPRAVRGFTPHNQLDTVPHSPRPSRDANRTDSMSGSAQLDDRNMAAPFEKADGELDGCALWGTQRDLFAERPLCTTLEAWPVASGGNLEVGLVRSGATERRVRPLGIVPTDVELDLVAHGVVAERQDDAAQALSLQGRPEAFEGLGRPSALTVGPMATCI